MIRWRVPCLGFCVLLLASVGSAPGEALAQESNRADTRDKRVMLLASMRVAVLEGYLQGEMLPAVMDLASFPGEIVTFDPTREELKDALEAARLMEEADALVRADKELKRAVSLYEKALVKNPADPVLMMAMGVAQAHSGQIKAAIATLKKAHEMAPDGYKEKQRIKNNLDAVRKSNVQ